MVKTAHGGVLRAAPPMVRLDAMIHAMKVDGRLREFNRGYATGRAAALAEGKGFMELRQRDEAAEAG